MGTRIKSFCQFWTRWQVAPNEDELEALCRACHRLHPAALGRALQEELVLTSTWSVVPWQPKFRALCIVEHFLKKGGSWRSVALSTHHAHAVFHCMMQVPECTRKASQVMTACGMLEKVEPKEQPAGGEAANATTAGVHSTKDEETKRKTEEEAEGKNAEAPEKCLEDFIKK